MEIVVIDGQGGGMGRNIIEALKKEFKDIFIIGVGTNTTATNNMKKGGADAIATGENAVVYNAKNASIIIGPIGIAFANSMYGEISPMMAEAISASDAKKYFIPVSKSNVYVAGASAMTIGDYIADIINQLK